MKLIPLILLLCACTSINRLADRIEYPSEQIWWEYRELRVIDIKDYQHHQRVTAVAGSPFPKYSYSYNNYFEPVKVGDIIPLTDSLRAKLHYHNQWRKL